MIPRYRMDTAGTQILHKRNKWSFGYDMTWYIAYTEISRYHRSPTKLNQSKTKQFLPNDLWSFHPYPTVLGYLRSCWRWSIFHHTGWGKHFAHPSYLKARPSKEAIQSLWMLDVDNPQSSFAWDPNQSKMIWSWQTLHYQDQPLPSKTLHFYIFQTPQWWQGLSFSVKFASFLSIHVTIHCHSYHTFLYIHMISLHIFVSQHLAI